MMAEPAVLLEAYCPNPLCPNVLRVGKRRVIGKAAPGSLSEFQCRDCGERVLQSVTVSG